jgi:hypothetical protein
MESWSLLVSMRRFRRQSWPIWNRPIRAFSCIPRKTTKNLSHDRKSPFQFQNTIITAIRIEIFHFFRKTSLQYIQILSGLHLPNMTSTLCTVVFLIDDIYNTAYRPIIFRNFHNLCSNKISYYFIQLSTSYHCQTESWVLYGRHVTEI